MNTLVTSDPARSPAPTTTIELPRFGDCAYGDSDVFQFPWGLPGFARLRRFLVICASEQDGYFWLQSLDDTSVAIPLCDPWSLFDDYEAPLPLYAKQSLQIDTPESFCVLCVLVASPDAQTTINLLAPIVINLQTRLGRQVTLENQRYSVRTPVKHAIENGEPKEDVPG